MGEQDVAPAIVAEVGSLPTLPAVADGHLIRRVEGNRPWDLAPRSARPVLKVVSIGGAVVVAGGFVALLLASVRHGLVWWWFLGKGGWALFAGLGAGLSRLFTRFVGWQLRRSAGLQMRFAALTGKREGTVVRIVGEVQAQRPFAGAVTGRPAVLARYRAVPRDGVPSDVTRGQDFSVRLEDGQIVNVAAADAFLTDEPMGNYSVDPPPGPLGRSSVPASDTVYRESRIGPGDRVEVIGMLDRVVDPSGEAAPGRGVPTVTMVRGTDRVPLLVRALRS